MGRRTTDRYVKEFSTEVIDGLNKIETSPPAKNKESSRVTERLRRLAKD